MRFPRFFFFPLAAACFGLLATASIKAGGDEWRPVSSEELGMKTPKVEPGADAEAIFWEVRIDDSSAEDLAMQHYVRVKIFTEHGLEKYSKFDIPFTRGMKIKDIAARVTKPDGSAVEIQKEDIFEREILKANGIKVKTKSFAIPGLAPGVIVEYRYREVISDAGASGMRLRFQRDIPVQTLSYYYKPYNKRTPNYQSFNFDNVKFVEGEKGFWVAALKDAPALKEEPRMPPENQVVPWMLLQSVRLNITQASFGSIIFSIKDPRNPASYWGSVGRERSYLTKLMNKPDKEIKRVAAEITATASAPEDKLKKLYEYCQTQIRNTSFDTTLTDEQRKKLPEIKSVSDVLKHKVASSRFVDMLFGAMANSLGYETRIAFSGNRNEMFFKPEMTNESFIHPAAIAVRVGDNWGFHNPGLSLLPYGMLIWYETDVWALLVGETSFTWVRIPYSEVDKSVARRRGTFNLLADGTLQGEVKIEYDGQSALVHRLESYDKSGPKLEEGLKAEVKQRMSTAEVSNVSIENITDSKKPLVYSFKVSVPGYAQRTGKRLFIQPGFFEKGIDPLFSARDRRYEVYFHYPWSEQDEVSIDLPAGYALDNAEQPAPFGVGEISRYKVSIGITTDQRTLVYKRNFSFGGGGNIVFPTTSYPAIKQLFDAVHTQDNHTITLKIRETQ